MAAKTVRLGWLAALCAVAVAAPATAGTTRRATHAVPAAPYTFHGRVVTAPGAGATSLQVHVSGGNQRALHALIGSTQPVTFTLGARTRVVEWVGRLPHHATTAALEAGDP